MATVEENKAAHGGSEPRSRKDHAGELGDGGCNVIRDKNGVVGRWRSWETASRALNELQELGFRYEYRLEESHDWVRATEFSTTCSLCNITRGIPAFAGRNLGVEWP